MDESQASGLRCYMDNAMYREGELAWDRLSLKQTAEYMKVRKGIWQRFRLGCLRLIPAVLSSVARVSHLSHTLLSSTRVSPAGPCMPLMPVLQNSDSSVSFSHYHTLRALKKKKKLKHVTTYLGYKSHTGVSILIQSVSRASQRQGSTDPTSSIGKGSKNISAAFYHGYVSLWLSSCSLRHFLGFGFVWLHLRLL